MTLYLITEKITDQVSFKENFKKGQKFTKFNLNYSLSTKINIIENKEESFIILITNTILSRKDKNYKVIKNYIQKNKKITFIEVGFNKSLVETNKATSNTLMHGFNKNSWVLLEKLIKSRIYKP